MIRYDAGTTNPTLLNRLGDWRDHEAWVDFVRSSKRTPTEVTPRRPTPDLPIIGLAALLSLVEWIEERRIKSQQGGPSCDDHQANVSPPAPDRAQPRRGSSTGGTSGRKGGLA